MGDGLRQGLGSVLAWIWLAQLVFKFFVFLDAAFRKQSAYVSAGKMTKQGWLIILGVVLVSDMLLGSVTSFFTILGVVAAIVYLVDVRPALRQVSGKGNKPGQHMGPYGPW